MSAELHEQESEKISYFKERQQKLSFKAVNLSASFYSNDVDTIPNISRMTPLNYLRSLNHSFS